MNKLFYLKQLPIENVIVYSDIAQIKRSLRVVLSKGENEVICLSASNFIDQDSIRVIGHGDATILDIVCRNRNKLTDQNGVDERIIKLKTRVSELEIQEKSLLFKKSRIERQTELLHSYAGSLSKLTDEKFFMNFVDLYSNNVEELDNKKMIVIEELEKVVESLNIARTELNHVYDSDNMDSIEISILLDSKQDNTQVELEISYLVSNASWSPKYDIRVLNNDKMTINYYGVVKQATEEDWDNAKIFLSTAIPYLNSVVPQLEILNIRRRKEKILLKKKKYGSSMMLCFGSSRSALLQKNKKQRSVSADSIDRLRNIDFSEAQVHDSLIATNFEITHKSSIPSDNRLHKVLIVSFDLNPEFYYESVPKMSSHVYLKAKVKNISSYPLLSGLANVFIDGSFVAKTLIRSCSPQEMFDCSLGAVKSILIDYKPIRKYFEGTKTKRVTYSQVIQIKNNTSSVVNIKVFDQLPLSNDDKLNVKLLEPNLKQEKNVKINKQNNLEFDVTLNSASEKELKIKYVIVNRAKHDEFEFFNN